MDLIDSTDGRSDKIGYAQVLWAIIQGASSVEEVMEAIENFSLEDELNVLRITKELE